MLLEGWKDFVRVAGCCLRKLKDRHYRVQPIPFVKKGACQQSRIEITEENFLSWLRAVGLDKS
jgi:hypothetical protein